MSQARRDIVLNVTYPDRRVRYRMDFGGIEGARYHAREVLGGHCYLTASHAVSYVNGVKVSVSGASLTDLLPDAATRPPSHEQMVDRITRRAKRAILRDLRDGTIPATRELGDLHDFVDANMYLTDATGEYDADWMRARGVPERPGEPVEVPSDAVNTDELNEPYEVAWEAIEKWVAGGALVRAGRRPRARR